MSASGVQDVPRVEVMAAWYAEGRTLKEIGGVFGITRERVRQLLNARDPFRRITSTWGKPLDVGALIRTARRAESWDALWKEAAIAAHRRGEALLLIHELGMQPALERLYRLRARAHLIRELRAVAQSIGRTPTSTDMTHCRHGLSNHHNYITVFGGMAPAYCAAGLTPPPRGGLAHARFGGETIASRARTVGLSASTIAHRVKRGMTLEQALALPRQKPGRPKSTRARVSLASRIAALEQRVAALEAR